MLLTPLTAEAEDNSKIKPAYGIYLTGLLIAGMITLMTAMSQLVTAIDIFQKLHTHPDLVELSRIALLLIGTCLAWWLIWVFVARLFAIAFSGLIREVDEMKLGNTYYFLIRSVILVGLMVMMNPLLTELLQGLMPQVPFVFIH